MSNMLQSINYYNKMHILYFIIISFVLFSLLFNFIISSFWYDNVILSIIFFLDFVRMINEKNAFLRKENRASGILCRHRMFSNGSFLQGEFP